MATPHATSHCGYMIVCAGAGKRAGKLSSAVGRTEAVKSTAGAVKLTAVKSTSRFDRVKFTARAKQ